MKRTAHAAARPALHCLAVSLAVALAFAQPALAAPLQKQVEKLDRGIVAIAAGGGVFVGWRVLGTDAADTRFNVYRDGVKVSAAPLEASNLFDAGGTTASQYLVRTVEQG